MFDCKAFAKKPDCIIIIHQPTLLNQEELESDFSIIARALASKSKVQIFSTYSGKCIATYEPSRNLLENKRSQKRAMARIKAYFTEMLKTPPTEPVNDMSVLANAIDSINYDDSKRVVLLMLTSGLHYDRALDFRGRIPNDWWIIETDISPYSLIKPAKKKELLVIMGPHKRLYVNTGHAKAIKRFYHLLFHVKVKARALAFTFNRNVVKKLIENPKLIKSEKPPVPNYHPKELILTEVETLESE